MSRREFRHKNSDEASRRSFQKKRTTGLHISYITSAPYTPKTDIAAANMAPARRGGGGGGGVGRNKKGDVYRIGGVDLPWDPELDLDKPQPTPLFPV